MPPDQAIHFLLSNGVDARTAGLVMKNMMLKKQAQQAQGQQQQPPPTTVAQDLDNHINSIAASKARQTGIGGLPVSSSLYTSGDEPHSMAGGGLIAFDDGGPVPTSTGGTDYATDQQSLLAQQMIAQQQTAQAQAMAQQSAQNPSMSMARGGIAHFDQGGSMPYDPNEDPTPDVRSPPSNWEQMNSAFDRWGGIHSHDPLAIPPPQQQPRPMHPSNQQMQASTQSSVPPNANNLPNPLASLEARQQQMQASTQSSVPPNANNLPNPLASLEARQQQDVNAAKPMTEDQYSQQLVDTANKQSIGAAGQAHLEELDQRKQVFAQMAQQGKWQALAQAGFAMAQAATTNPHAGFLGALAVGGQKGAEEYGKTLAQYHTNMAQLQDAKYQVQQNQENVRLGLMKMGNEDYKNAVTRYDNLQGRVDSTTIKAQEQMYGRELTAMTTRATIMAKTQFNPETATYQDLVNNQHMDPIEALQKVRAASPQVQAADKREQGTISAEGIKWLNSGERMQLEHRAKTDPNSASQLAAIDRQYNIPQVQAADKREQGTISAEGIKWLNSDERMQLEHRAKTDPNSASQLAAIDRQYNIPQAGGTNAAQQLPPGWSVTPKQSPKQ
jgi:hypothetical protein